MHDLVRPANLDPHLLELRRAAALGIAHTREQEYNTNPFIPPAEVVLGTAPDPVIRVPVVDDVPGAVALTAPREIDVEPPPSESVDWNALIEESAGWLADADSAIATLTALRG